MKTPERVTAVDLLSLGILVSMLIFICGLNLFKQTIQRRMSHVRDVASTIKRRCFFDE